MSAPSRHAGESSPPITTDRSIVDVCVVGSANLDLVATAASLPHPGETVIGRGYSEHPGGKGLNQAVAAARSGASTAFVGAVGDDAAAEVLVDVLREALVDISGVVRRPGVPTGRALIGVADGGENQIIVVPGANATLDPAAIAAQPASRVLLAQLEVPVATVAAALENGRRMGAITVLNPAPAADLDRSVLGLVDIVVPNEHEVELLGGVDALLALGATSVVVTRGAAGVTVHGAAGVFEVPAIEVATVDTTGAGDTFCGAMCAELAAGRTLRDAVEFAVVAAALSTTVAGAVPSIPHRAAVDALCARSDDTPGEERAQPTV